MTAITRILPQLDEAIRIGYSLSLSGPLGANGQSARLAHLIWQDDVNRRGGLLGRPVQLICHDDRTDASLVPGIYSRLLDDEKVDLVIGGYGTNTLAPAMPLIIERRRFFVGLMGLGVNNTHAYPNYFAMIPTGPSPNAALTEGFFALAAAQSPRPTTMALISADAEFSINAVIGAKENADKYEMHIALEHRYPLSTADFAPIAGELKVLDPDVLFICSYLSDSVGLVRSINERGLRPRMVGGAMIGPQSASVKTALGPLLNGFVNYDYWVPAPMMFPGVAELISKYQERAIAAGVDPLGHYMAPLAYAQMQVVEQAVAATGSLDDEALAEHARHSVFETVAGDVLFGERGEWATPRVVQVQFQNVKSNDIAAFRDDGVQTVVWPPEFASGPLIYPYAMAKADR